MSLSRDEAQSALRDISKTEQRSISAYGYKSGAPFVILWGVLWFIGYGGTDLFPAYSSLLWIGVMIVGTVACTIIGIRMPGKGKFDWRIFGSWLASIGFISAVFGIIGHVTGNQMGAIIPLFIAWAYVIMGFWLGARFAIAGLVLAGLTLGGFYFLPEHFCLWMAFVGGGTLVLTGLWLRRV